MNAAKQITSLKILIVDDSELNRQTMASILESHGYNVVGVAANATEAITQANITNANLVFVDIVMPEISGVDLIKKLYDKYSQARFIVAMSSLNLEEIVIESIANGAIEFLKKPFSDNDLIKITQKIESMINK